MIIVCGKKIGILEMILLIGNRLEKLLLIKLIQHLVYLLNLTGPRMRDPRMLSRDFRDPIASLKECKKLFMHVQLGGL